MRPPTRQQGAEGESPEEVDDGALDCSPDCGPDWGTHPWQRWHGWRGWHHGHGRRRPPPPRSAMGRMGYYIRARLHRRIFVWFGISILVTGVMVAGVSFLFFRGEGSSFRNRSARAERFVGERVGLLWDRPEERDAWLRDASRELDLGLTLTDVDGRALVREGETGCARPGRIAVHRGARHLGELSICAARLPGSSLLPVVALLVLVLVLWGASGVIARRVMRPLDQVVHVAEEIGKGKLKTRVRLDHHRAGELSVVGDAINDMAARIEKQLSDQRELLAGVSHEIRTPLGHLRILLELAEAKGADPALVADFEREVGEIDALVGELLASSRLDFSVLEPSPLDGLELAEEALTRAGLPIDLLAVEGEGATEAEEEVAGHPDLALEGDPTLISRALANLVRNAERHGGGVTKLAVVPSDRAITFRVEDEGPGFSDEDLPQVFDAFYQGKKRGGGASLGLGLSLVRRIALAHGGRAFAENRKGKGAAVSLRLARTPPRPEGEGEA